MTRHNWLILIVTMGILPAVVRGDDASYRVDPAMSRVYVRVNADGRLGHSHGIEGRIKAGLIQLGGAGQITFDMTSFAADTPAARQYVELEGKVAASDARRVTANMLSAEVLDAGKYPTAVFDISSAKPLDREPAGRPGRYELTGQYTLHGVTRPIKVVAQAEATNKTGWLHLRGQFTLRQTEYGIKPYTALGGLVGVMDELTIFGDLYLQADGK